MSIFLKNGLPLLGFVCLGTYGISVFVQGKYDALDAKSGSQTTREFDLSQEYEKTMLQLETNMENYELKPVPRPDGSNMKIYNDAKMKYIDRKD